MFLNIGTNDKQDNTGYFFLFFLFCLFVSPFLAALGHLEFPSRGSDPSFDLLQLQQHWILYPTVPGWDSPCVLMLQRHRQSCFATAGTSIVFIFKHAHIQMHQTKGSSPPQDPRILKRRLVKTRLQKVGRHLHVYI